MHKLAYSPHLVKIPQVESTLPNFYSPSTKGSLLCLMHAIALAYAKKSLASLIHVKTSTCHFCLLHYLLTSFLKTIFKDMMENQ